MAGPVRNIGYLLLFALPAFGAAPLGDPTRPPSETAAGDSRQGEGSKSGSASDAPVSPRLQSIVLPADGGRPLAIIDGEAVRIGGKVGDARLVRLTEKEAVLRGPQGLERLFLTPEVDVRLLVVKGTGKREKP